MNTSQRLLIAGVFVLLFIVGVAVVTGRSLFVNTLFALGYAHDKAPDWYDETVGGWLGVGCRIDSDLSPEDEEKVIADELQFGESLMGDLKIWAIRILDTIGLLPEGQLWLESPMDPESKFRITQDWKDSSPGCDPLHPGVDWGCPKGSHIHAVAAGIVIKPSSGTLMWYLSDLMLSGKKGFGNTIWIDHGGIYTVYAHLSYKFVSTGQHVRRGEVIGLCGSTGNSTGPHLHFGVSDIHPDGFTQYHQFSPCGWLNPHDILGTCPVDTCPTAALPAKMVEYNASGTGKNG